MAEGNGQTPKDLTGFLDFWLVKKAPFQIPEGAKEWIVKWGPWIDVVLLVLAVPVILAAIGITAVFSPYAMTAGAGYTTWYWVGIVVMAVQLALQVAALPGLFARKMAGWTLLFYSEILSLVYSLITGSVVGGIISAVIGFYILFQIREKYAK